MPKWSRKRQNKDGTFSYTFRVYRGYTTDGDRLKPYVHTWKSPANLTERQADKEAERQALRFEEQCKTGLAGDATRITLAEFVPVYLKQARLMLSPTTYHNYKTELQAKILPALGHHKLSELKPVHVQAWVNQLAALEKPDGSKLSPSTVKRIYAILCAVIKHAMKQGLITQNPTDTDRVTLPRTTAPKVEIFTRQEAAAMLEALEGEPLQFQVLIQLAIITGARRGELVALKFSDFDRRTNQMTIERAAVKVDGEASQLKTPKTGQVRTVTVSPQCIALVDMLEQEKQRERLRLGSKWHEGGWLFTQWNGEMMNPQTPTKQFSKFLKRHGFQHRKFHALRHTSATLLLYGGVNLKQVQGRLGHGNISTTNKYLHCIAEADEQAAGVLQSMLLTCSKRPKDTEEQAEQKQA